MKTLVNALTRLAGTIRFGFCRLTEIQFSAPWTAPRSRCG